MRQYNGYDLCKVYVNTDLELSSSQRLEITIETLKMFFIEKKEETLVVKVIKG